MNIGIDFNKLINSQLNDLLLNVKTDDPEADKFAKTLVKFANKYGLFGADALNFITDFMKTLEELVKMQEDKK